MRNIITFTGLLLRLFWASCFSFKKKKSLRIIRNFDNQCNQKIKLIRRHQIIQVFLTTDFTCETQRECSYLWRITAPKEILHKITLFFCLFFFFFFKALNIFNLFQLYLSRSCLTELKIFVFLHRSSISRSLCWQKDDHYVSPYHRLFLICISMWLADHKNNYWTSIDSNWKQLFLVT